VLAAERAHERTDLFAVGRLAFSHDILVRV